MCARSFRWELENIKLKTKVRLVECVATNIEYCWLSSVRSATVLCRVDREPTMPGTDSQGTKP